MKDRYIVYGDGARRFVRDLSVAEIQECLAMLDGMIPMDGTDATHDEMRERLNIELLARSAGL